MHSRFYCDVTTEAGYIDNLRQWFPICGSPPQSGWRRSGCGCGLADNSLRTLLKARIFSTAPLNIVCYIIKAETRIDFYQVHIICVIIPIYYTDSIDLIVEIRHH